MTVGAPAAPRSSPRPAGQRESPGEEIGFFALDYGPWELELPRGSGHDWLDSIVCCHVRVLCPAWVGVDVRGRRSQLVESGPLFVHVLAPRMRIA